MEELPKASSKDLEEKNPSEAGKAPDDGINLKERTGKDPRKTKHDLVVVVVVVVVVSFTVIYEYIYTYIKGNK